MASVGSDPTPYLISHIILPPQLPQRDDRNASHERTLIETTIQALRDFHIVVGSEHDETVASVISTLTNMLRCRDMDGFVSESQLVESFKGLVSGATKGTIPLEVKVQNAGIIIRRHKDNVTFEFFELSPMNESVITTKGRLGRSFPAYASTIPITQFQEQGLIEALAHTISKMSIQVARGFQPQIRKAGWYHDEIRNTMHPGMITDYLMNVVSALGKPTEVQGISKNTREDVLWSNNPKLPWRRSPLWLLIRVSMQLQFTHAGTKKNIYKPFMIFFMAQILNLAGSRNDYIKNGVVYAILAKLSHRLRKFTTVLQSNTSPPKWLDLVRATMNRIFSVMDKNWKDTMDSTHANIDITALSKLRPEEDVDVNIPDLDDFIKRMVDRKRQPSSSAFQPSSTYPEFRFDEFPTVSGMHNSDRFFHLAAIEIWVEHHLSAWLGQNIGDNSTCGRLSRLIEDYHSAANDEYSGMPTSKSVMYLVIMELWVACDKSACHIHPLLCEFNPEIKIRVLQSLTLPLKSQVHRLLDVEDHLRYRQSKAKAGAPSLFREFGHSASFAVKYFDWSSDHQALRHKIEKEAAVKREEKCKELAQKQQQYRDLMLEHDQKDCTYRQIVVDPPEGTTKSIHNEYGCSKCSLRRQAEEISISIEEWPLSSDVTTAKATVFELKIPEAFSKWRDITVFLSMHVLGSSPGNKIYPRVKITLASYQGLSSWHSAQLGQNIKVLSEIMSHAGSHRKKKEAITGLKEEDICLNNALKFRYYDSRHGFFTDILRSTNEVADHCKYQLPKGSSQLQQFLYRPPSMSSGLPPNTVIAEISECPSHMSIDEYKAFSTIPLGYNIQYSNIMTQLAMPTVDFAKAETHCLMLQTIHQVGPPANDKKRERASLSILNDEAFCEAMVAQLEAAMQRVKENWESWRALATFIQVATKVLNFTSSLRIREQCLEYLAEARRIALRWLNVLKKRAFLAADDKYRADLNSKITEIALACITTFDVDNTLCKHVICTSSELSILLQCAITVQENKTTVSPEHKPLYQTMLQSWQSLLYRLFPIIVKESVSNGTGLNDAITASWPLFSPSGHWSALSKPLNHWLKIKSGELPIYFNLLTAELLVDGLPLSRLPPEYIRHDMYSLLFHKSSLEVMPASEPGMKFSAKDLYRGYTISLGMEGLDMLVVAERAREKLHLLPPRIFADRFPTTFVRDFVHWYDYENNEVHFQPKNNPWSFNSSNWRLTKSNTSWRLIKDEVILVDIARDTALTLFNIFSRLADRMDILIRLDTISHTVTIDIPKLQLAFYFNHQDSQLNSQQYRGMIVDPDQRVGTLNGLPSKLVLKPAHDMGDRMVLIPDGSVTYSKTSDYVAVDIEKITAVKTHVYVLDSNLGRIIDNGSLQSRLYLCYLHALTSHFLPDPLTGHTGTEAALSILQSAAVRSFRILTQADIDVLEKIVNIVPCRWYFPQGMTDMQEVKWNPDLPFLSQHPGFFTRVEVILNQARKEKFFHSGKEYVEPIALKLGNPDLLQRDLIRSSIFRVSDHGAEDYSLKYDNIYSARDKQADNKRGHLSYQATRMVVGDRAALVSSYTLDQYASIRRNYFENCTAKGSQNGINESELKYDEKWLGDPKDYLSEMWCGLHVSLSQSSGTFNKFQIAMWLSAASYAASADPYIIQSLAAFYRLPDLASIAVPSDLSFNLRLGDSPGTLMVQNIVESGALPVYSCPEASLQRKENESEGRFRSRKRATHRRKLNAVVNSFSRALLDQWPCKKLLTPENIQDASTYLDVSKVMVSAASRFKACKDNQRFYEYLRDVFAMLSQQTVVELITQHHCAFEFVVSPNIDGSSRVFRLEDIFRQPAPVMPEIPFDLPRYAEYLLKAQCMNSQTSKNKGRLDHLCRQLESQTKSRCEKNYVQHLKNSCNSLELQTHVQNQVASTEYGIVASLKLYLTECYKYLEKLNQIFGIVLEAAHGFVPYTQHCPRVSPTLLLSQLNNDHFLQLSEDWKRVVIEYGIAITRLHRAQRLVALAGNPLDLAEELRNHGHQNWDPKEHPESLLLEAESCITIRDVQRDIARQMISPSGEQNAVMQLNMGEGKSSVIVPICATELADRERLVRVIVGKPQSKQMLQMLISKLGGLLNRRIFHMPFSRALKLSTGEAETIAEIYKDCMATRGILLVQPEQILSFKLMGIECLLSNRLQLGQSLLQTQNLFDTVSRDIVDESDENFSPKFELVYTVGTQKSIEMSPERWVIIHTILSLVSRYARIVKTELTSSIEVDSRLDGMFPRIRTLREDANEMLLERVAKHICENGLLGFAIQRQSQKIRDAVFRYITELNLNDDEISAVETSPFWTEPASGILLLIRGLIGCGILRFALGSKRWRVNYGLDTNRTPPTQLAVPYRSKDNPSPHSEFSHPDVVIVLTSLTYYYGGLNDEELFTTFTHLQNSDQADVEYSEWVKTAASYLPNGFRHLSGVNIKDRFQCIDHLFPPLRYSKGVIDYFLCHLVFPKEMKEYPQKLSASGWDIGQIKSHPTTGFSGTNDSRHILPLSVQHLDLDTQKHTNALVLGYLLQDENTVEIFPPRAASATSDAEHLLIVVNSMSPAPRVILDVGAQILELNNYEVAKDWLSMSNIDTIKAAVFVNDHEDLSVLDRNGRVEPLQTSPFAKQLDLCLVYLDEAHTRGIDLKLPREYRAAVTLGANLTKDRLVQACMRMRKLGKGQSVVFCVPEEIQTKIRESTSKSSNADIEVCDVLCWAISETWIDLRRSMPLWATQGRRFEEHKNLLHGADTTPDQVKMFLEDEALGLEYRYKPRLQVQATEGLFSDWDISNPNIAQIITRCRDFDILTFTSAALEEEQERELSHEIEEERQVQRPPRMDPEDHKIHKDLIHLVETGKLRPNSRAFIPAFQAMTSTSAAPHFDLGQFPTGLLVTADFVRTVKRPSGLLKQSFVSDSYQRAVQWILSVYSKKTGFVQNLIILSPYEADRLITAIRESSKVTLHLYAPRSSVAYKSLDRLELYNVGRPFKPTEISRSLTVLLNLFAGQLYLRSFEEYTEICEFLGLAWTAANDGDTVMADGFRMHHAGPWNFTKSPIHFLRLFLINVRRQGESVEKTHLGRILDGALLEESDFE